MLKYSYLNLNSDKEWQARTVTYMTPVSNCVEFIFDARIHLQVCKAAVPEPVVSCIPAVSLISPALIRPPCPTKARMTSSGKASSSNLPCSASMGGGSGFPVTKKRRRLICRRRDQREGHWRPHSFLWGLWRRRSRPSPTFI